MTRIINVWTGAGIAEGAAPANNSVEGIWTYRRSSPLPAGTSFTKTGEGFRVICEDSGVARLDGDLPGATAIRVQALVTPVIGANEVIFLAARNNDSNRGVIQIGADGRIGFRDGAVISASRAPAITAGDQVLLDVVWATGSGTTGRVFYRCTNVTNLAWNGGAPFFWDSGATRTLTAINRVAAGVVDVLAIPAPGVRIEKLGAESIIVDPAHTSQAQAQAYFADPPVQEVPLATPSPVVTAIKQPTTTGGSDGTITVGYPVVTNAASYEHYMKKDGAAAVLVGTTPTLTYTHTGLTSGSYEALVRAIP